MTTTEINAPLFRKVLEHLTAHPDAHNPGAWRGCIAGHTVLLAGHTLVRTNGSRLYWVSDDVRDRAGKRRRSIAGVATVDLGLTIGQAERLFRPRNTLADLWRLASTFTSGEITPPSGATGYLLAGEGM